MTKETQKALTEILDITKRNLIVIKEMHTLIEHIIKNERIEDVKNPNSPNVN